MTPDRRLKPITTLLVILSALSLYPLNAEELIHGEIAFRGKIEADAFRSTLLDAVVEKNTLQITAKRTEANFSFPFENQTLRDVILSPNQGAAAVHFKRRPWSSRRNTVATVNRKGEIRSYEYKSYEMTDKYGWIVELGAVSEDGRFLLAKCAFMLPPEGQMQRVNHAWIVLEIKEGAIVVNGEEGGIDQWAKVTIPTEGEQEAQQAGTGQPATRPESKSEGGEKLQPEAEWRSR